jgi:1-deoxy-D-xylulose-5-phosphate reductoisomerase
MALEKVTVEQALRHPTWRMGAKITIDSATLMNKGLEVVEAHWLFGVPLGQIDVVVHPQSIVHSMVEFVDRSVLAQLGMPDMGIPILYALAYPDRLACPAPALDLVALSTLTFEAPDDAAFPCLALARQAGQAGGAAPLVLNAANEVAVAGFLAGRCGFMDIPRLIGDALDTHSGVRADDLDARLELDGAVRRTTEAVLGGVPAGSVRR